MKAKLSSSLKRGSSDKFYRSAFIPDLCALNSVLMLLISAQFLALVVTLIASAPILMDWELLGFVSLFVHFIILSSAAVLCQLRVRLSALTTKQQAAFCFALILITILAFSVFWLWFLPAELVGDGYLFVLRSLLVGSLITGMALRYFYIQHLGRAQKQAELQARIEALQARIRPHFLFNSMNSIASLIDFDPQKAEAAVLDLSALFRATLNTSANFVSLKEELSLCQRYLNIEALRLGNRLSVEWIVSEEVKLTLIPPLTIQPLIENAIYHGIQPSTQGGEVKLEAYLRDASVYVLVSNPVAECGSTHTGSQTALENIQARLKALFNEEAVLKTSQLNGVFTCMLRFPADQGGQ